MATLDLIQRAHAAGMNFVISHEPTFWSDRDTVDELAADPVYKFKTDFWRNSMVVWRFHDHIHAHQPDLIWVGLARALGWQEQPKRLFKFPETTLGALAADVQSA